MSDVFALIAVLLSLATPYWYSRRNNLSNRLLFFAATIGLATIFEFLFLVAAFPVIVLGLFVVPQLNEHGVLNNISWLVQAGSWAAEYIYVLLVPLYFVSGKLLHRKYAFFQPST